MHAQIIEVNSPQTAEFQSIGAAGFPYAAQSFIADVNILNRVEVWLREFAPGGEVRLGLAMDRAGLPWVNRPVWQSGLLNPAPGGGWLVDSTLREPLIPGKKYWLFVDGFNNTGASGSASVGTSGTATDSGDPLYYASNPSPTWVTLTGLYMALRLEGDTCTVPVNILPDSTPTFCQGDSLALSTANTYQQYLWSNGDTTPVSQVDSSAVYEVAIFDGSCGGTDTETAIETTLPPFSLGPDQEVCDGSVVDLIGPSCCALNYSWNNGGFLYFIQVTTSGTYYLDVSDTNGCLVSDTVNVTFFPRPNPMIGQDTVLCAGQNYVLDPGQGYTAYFWNDGQTTRSIVVSTTGQYSVVVQDTNGCSGSSNSVNVLTVPNPGVPLISKDEDQLSSTSAFSYQWQLDGVPVPGANAQTLLPQQSGNYSMTVTDTNGCSSTSANLAVVTDVDRMRIPEGISPNGDGLNDFFFIEGIEFFPGNELTVYNRWGNVVYRVSNYDGYWSGRGFSGEPLPDATYIYTLDLGDGSPVIQNTVVINR